MTSIKEIEGIGSVFAEKLASVGVRTTEQLLEVASTPSERMKLADQARLGDDQLLHWIHQADLFRINGVGEEFAELLVSSGVTTVPKLAYRNAENLHIDLIAYNHEHHVTKIVPSVAELEKMIAHAKTLPKVVHH